MGKGGNYKKSGAKLNPQNTYGPVLNPQNSLPNDAQFDCVYLSKPKLSIFYIKRYLEKDIVGHPMGVVHFV